MWWGSFWWVHGSRPGWLEVRVLLPRLLLPWLLLVPFYSWDCLGGAMMCRSLVSLVLHIGVVGFPWCLPRACCRILWWRGPCCRSGKWGQRPPQNNCQNHIQILKVISFFLFDIPLDLLSSLMFFCNSGDRYFLILANFFGILPLLAQEEGEGKFQ